MSEAVAKLIETLATVAEAFGKAPKSLAVILIVTFVFGFQVSTWYYAGRVADAQQRVGLRDDQIDDLKSELAGKAAAVQGPAQFDVSALAATLATRSLILSWGAGNPYECQAAIDGAPLAPYSLGYYAVVICGIERPGVDHVTDTAVTVTPPFNIDGRFHPYAEASPAMRKVVTDMTDPLPLGGSIRVSTWTELGIFPKSVDVKEIRSLADLAKHGGTRVRSGPGAATTVTLGPKRLAAPAK